MCFHEQCSAVERKAITDSPDFCQIFIRQLNSFYRLAFLLTASHSQAERCTLASLEEALNCTAIDSSLAEPWSRRCVIRNALRLVRQDSSPRDLSAQRQEASKVEFTGWPFNAIVGLEPFERCVFVLSVLEKIEEAECARLLTCAVSEIAGARIRALQSLSTFEAIEKEGFIGRSLAPSLAYDCA